MRVFREEALYTKVSSVAATTTSSVDDFDHNIYIKITT